MTDTPPDDTPTAARRREPADRRAPRQAHGAARAGHRVPERLPPRRLRRRPAGRVRRRGAVDRRGAGRQRPPRRRRRPPDAQAGDGQGQLRADPGRAGRIQLFLQSNALGETYDAFKGWDVGDIVAAEGTLTRTRTGELSVKADTLRLLTKSLRPLPDKWHGLADVEQRYRQRYVDLIVTPEAREVFVKRSKIIRAMRELAGRAALPRSRDADDALHPRRRRGQAVRHPPQRARPGPVPARGAGAVPQAPGRRRPGARLRDQPQLPQRGRVAPGTTPSSPCSSCTRPTPPTTRSWT